MSTGFGGCIALGLSSWLLSDAAAALTAKDFAYGMPVLAREVAAAYRVQLPVDVYRVSVHDLSDVRVFDAQGQVVPSTIRRMDPQSAFGSAVSGPTQALTLTPQRADAAGGGVQYLLDARPFDSAIGALTLFWPESRADFAGRMRVECSDDLAAWRVMVAAAPIANLHTGTQQVIESRIETPGIKAQFWRLTWLGHGPSFELNEVRAEAAGQGPPRVNWSTVVIPGHADPHSASDYDFDLGARLPLQRVDLIVPDADGVYLADFKSRAEESYAWREVVHAGVYRLTTADGSQINGPVEVPVNRDRYWRVHLSGASGGSASLRLQGSWSPSDIEFAAQGAPPYLLAYGSSDVSTSATGLSGIPGGATFSTATLGSRSALGGERRRAALDAPLGQRNVWWAVLAMGAAALAAIAVRIVRNRMRSTR